MALSTTAKLIPANVPGGAEFTPTITFGGASVGMTYTAQEGRLWRPLPGVIQFSGRCILSAKGSSTGAVVFRLPATDANGDTIPVPVLSTTHALELVNVTTASIDQHSALQTAASLSVQLFKRTSTTRTALVNTDVIDTFQCYVSGFYFYTP